MSLKDSLLGVALFVSLMAQAAADIRIKIRTVNRDGRVEYQTVYVKNDHRRVEIVNGPETLVRLLDCKEKKVYLLDPFAGRYAREDWAFFPASADGKAAPKVDGAGPPGDEVERKELFGMVAKHYTKHEGLGPPPRVEQTAHRQLLSRTTDIWVTDLATPVRKNCEPDFIDTGRNFRLALRVIEHWKTVYADGQIKETSEQFQEEVVEFSQDPLPESLFKIPAGFKKVPLIAQSSDRNN